jgi:archaellum biogenesis ATPase FlaH
VLITDLWAKMPGKFFCVSTKSESGKWRDTFFSKDELGTVRHFIKDHMDDDVYFCPHGFNRRSRSKEEAVIPPMCWADLDAADPRKIDIKPTIALESSPGRFVGLWLTDEPISESLNRRLTYAMDADHGGWDLTQVLRFPGTTNYKYSIQPKVRILWDDGPTYTVKKLDKRLPVETVEVGEEHEGESARDVYARYERALPPWCRRELLSGKPRPGQRSEMLWKVEHALLEAGITQEECFILIKASPWNKFAGRHNEDVQLRRELEKIMSEHFTKFKKTPSGKDQLQERRLEEKHQKTGKDVKGEPRKTRREEEEDRKARGERKFLNISMDKVVEEELDWVWYPYLALGELTILEGDPGLGKSYMAQMVAGHIVDGKRLPQNKPTGKKPPKGKVAYFDMENSAGTVTKRRLVDNGVENLAYFLQEETPFSIDDEDALDEIYEALEDLEPTLVVFDTLNTYIGKADTHKSSEVQQAFAHFRQIAIDFNCAVLVLRHLTKSKGGDKAIYRGQGSIAFTGLARVVMTVGQMPEDPETRVMAVTKINVTKPPKALCFTIEELPKDRSRFVWGDFVNLSSDDILAGPSKGSGGRAGDDAESAKIFLEEVLEDGPEEVMKLKRMAEKRSISYKVLVRAAESMGLEKFDDTIKGQKVKTWGLPEDYEASGKPQD